MAMRYLHTMVRQRSSHLGTNGARTSRCPSHRSLALTGSIAKQACLIGYVLAASAAHNLGLRRVGVKMVSKLSCSCQEQPAQNFSMVQSTKPILFLMARIGWSGLM